MEIGAHDRVQACKEKPTSDARLVTVLEFLEGGEDADEGGLLPNEWDQCLRPLRVSGIFVRKLLPHELVFRDHAPEKQGREEPDGPRCQLDYSTTAAGH